MAKVKSELQSVKKVNTTVSMSTEVKKKEVPKGAKIESKTVNTSTEQIENGYLIRKSYDISYSLNGDRGYAYYTKIWYTKDDPLTVTVNDKSLADEFDVDD